MSSVVLLGSAAILAGLAPINVSQPGSVHHPGQSPANPPAQPARRRGRPPGKGKASRKRPRHSSSSESSASSLEPSSSEEDSDADSDTSHRRHSRAGSAKDEAVFMSTLTGFWQGQGETGQKLLRKHRHPDALKLYSGMPTVNVYYLWLAVMAVGGYETVNFTCWLQKEAMLRCPRCFEAVLRNAHCDCLSSVAGCHGCSSSSS